MYVEGSYFGDSDVLADKNNDGRDGTAVIDARSKIFVITRKDLLSVLKHFKNTYSKEMHFIAKERRLHHKAAIDELKLQNIHIKKKLIKAYKHNITVQAHKNVLQDNASSKEISKEFKPNNTLILKRQQIKTKA
jgi:hypothetical protein